MEKIKRNGKEIMIPTTIEGWESLRNGEVYENYVAAYNYFMFDKCGGNPLPCGQQKCWVDCHHKYREEN